MNSQKTYATAAIFLRNAAMIVGSLALRGFYGMHIYSREVTQSIYT